jgi:toxin ParE1/3/4
MKSYRVIWTPQAECDLREIKRYISRDAPSTARAFIRRIRERVRKMGTMPMAASRAMEAARGDVREIYVGDYRIIFRIRENDVRILTVMHGARLVREDKLSDDES